MITLAMIAALSMPPEKYDHPPARPVEVVDFPANLIEAMCRTSEPFSLMLGCLVGDKIYVRDDLSRNARAYVLRHEYGHVNGWEH